MPNSYSPELRGDVLTMDEARASTSEIVIELNVSPAWVRRVKQEFREHGKTVRKTTRDRKCCWEKGGSADWLVATLKQKPDLYRHGLRPSVALSSTSRPSPGHAKRWG